MPSASELISKLLPKKRAEDAERKAVHERYIEGILDWERSAKQRQRDEHKRKLQHSKEVADRVLVESGVLGEIKAIKRNNIDGNFRSTALFTNYCEAYTDLYLVWGEAFSLEEKLLNGERTTLIKPESWLFSSREIEDYYRMVIRVDALNESIMVNDVLFEKSVWQNDRQKVNDSLAQTFLYAPKRTGPDYSRDNEYSGPF